LLHTRNVLKTKCKNIVNLHDQHRQLQHAVLTPSIDTVPYTEVARSCDNCLFKFPQKTFLWRWGAML